MRTYQPSLATLLTGILGIATIAVGCSDSTTDASGDMTTGVSTAGVPEMGGAGTSAAPGTAAPTAGAEQAGTAPGATPAVAPDPGVPGGAPAAGETEAGQTDTGAAAGTPPALGVEEGAEPAAGGETVPTEDMSGAQEMGAAEAGGMESADGMSSVDEPAAAEGDPVGMGDPDPAGEDPAPEQPEAPVDDGEAFGPDIEGSCTQSQPANSNASGSGPYDVIVETNSDPGIKEGTIFRPADLGGDEPYPIFVWGEGGCSQNGLSNSAAMAEIASYGYFVVADGTPNGSGNREMNSNDVPSMGEPLLAYVDWAIAENSKPCSAYYHSLNASKVAANGFSCGGLMSTGTSGDPRMTTWGSTSSGTFSVNNALYEAVHTPVLIVSGGPSDIAYENGLRDYDNLSAMGLPIMFFSKDIGHGGDLFQGGNGDFTKINLAWLNWWLKGDESEAGKGMLVGGSCSYCTDNAWEVMSANLP